MRHTCCCSPFSTSHPRPHADTRCTPVTIMMQKFPDIFMFSNRSKACPKFTCFHVTLHRWIHCFQKSEITTHLIFCPWSQNTNIPPVINCHRNHYLPLSWYNDQRYCHRNSTAFILLTSNIFEPFLKETTHIKVVSCCRGK